MDSKRKEELRELYDDVLELEALIQLALMREDCSTDLLRLIDKKKNIILGIQSEDILKKNESVPINEIQPEQENTDSSFIDGVPDSDIEVYEYENSSSVQINDEEENKIIEEYTLDVEDDSVAVSSDVNFNIKQPRKLRGRLVFSINDRYRFKRELFNNSDADLNTTLAFVASMDDYEEAEEYFIDELGFDPKNQTVVDFFDVLSKYFN